MIDITTLLFVFIFGTLIGSFVNVVALRYKTGLSIYNDRSKCFHCGTTLKWYELVPVFSFLFLRGRCRTCHTRISLQYPIMEILTGFIFVAVFLRQLSLWPIYEGFTNGLAYSVFFFVYYVSIFSLLNVIAIYDSKHKIIPNKLVYTFIFLSLFKLVLFFVCRNYLPLGGLTRLNWLDLLSPIITSAPLAFLWFISRGRWIGFGDVKLAFGIGALLGFVSGISAIVLSFWIGAAWGILLIFRSKFTLNPKNKLGMKTEVPFAPFLILATLISFLFRIDLLSITSLLALFNYY